jgi:hypothetical protein
MKPLHYEAICQALLERFGEPIGDRTVGDNQGVPTGTTKKDMGNRGFGSQLDEAGCCEQCGTMQSSMDQAHACEGDGYMPEDVDEADDLDQVAPPGGEKVVKALKKQKGVKNPWAVAWAMKNRGQI